MRNDFEYPAHVGVSDVTTRSFEQMRVEAVFELARIPMVVTRYRESAAEPVLVERLHVPDGPTPEERLADEARPPRRRAGRSPPVRRKAPRKAGR